MFMWSSGPLVLAGYDEEGEEEEEVADDPEVLDPLQVPPQASKQLLGLRSSGWTMGVSKNSGVPFWSPYAFY